MIQALFVDNDKSSLVIFEEICRQEKITFTGIQNPERVVETIRDLQQPLNVIFLDLEMPMLNGYEVLNLLRTISNLDSIPVIACTVYDGEFNNARAAGFSGFILKPIELSQFSRFLNTILQGKVIWQNH